MLRMPAPQDVGSNAKNRSMNFQMQHYGVFICTGYRASQNGCTAVRICGLYIME
jgi:hypothetical protein